MKVVVVGAGIAGLTVAYALVRRGHRVALIERAARLKGDVHMLEISGAGHIAAERLGLLPELQRINVPISRLVFHAHHGREFASVAYGTLRRSLFRDRHLCFTRGALEAALYALVRSEVDVKLGTSVERLTTEGEHVRVHLSDGSAPAADLVVGADGARSSIRSQMFGLPEESFRSFLGYRAAAYVAEDATLARALGQAIHVLAVPGRQLTTFPFGPDRVACLFAHRSDDADVDRSREAMRSELRREYGRMPWVTTMLLEHAEAARDIYFDVVSQVDVPQWSAGRVALLGDAAHGVSLLAGQGASLAMAGAFVFAEELARRPEGALRRYEIRMRGLVMAVQRAGRQAGPWLVPETRLGLLRHHVAARFPSWPLASRVVRGVDGAERSSLLDLA